MHLSGGPVSKLSTILLLVGSNLFMTFAWYGHLKTMRNRALFIVILASWSIAFFEYCLQVPANRIGYGPFSLAQLKVLQEVISVSVFAAFTIVYMREPLRLDFLWAGLCLVGAAYFMFRSAGVAH
ncbi:MAG: DMT family protein [Candidatus Hydrogenedentes bacterium]|nr:DMT family protein [Candidatus Hydrogenedentota bacterium]